MRISACLIVNLVKVHVKERKSEYNLIANGRTGCKPGQQTVCISHQLRLLDSPKTNIVPIRISESNKNTDL